MIQLFSNLLIRKENTWWLIILFALSGFLFIPFKLSISPERKFKVVDDNGAPIQNARIQQIWYQYSLRYSDDKRVLSASNGFVMLPQREVKTRYIDLLSGAIGKIVEYTIHASICSSDSVFVYAYGYAPVSFFDGEGLGDTVVLKKQ
jgi:hypothetical protein